MHSTLVTPSPPSGGDPPIGEVERPFRDYEVQSSRGAESQGEFHAPGRIGLWSAISRTRGTS